MCLYTYRCGKTVSFKMNLSRLIHFSVSNSLFGTCALCPRQRLLVMPCQNAAVVFRARVQLYIT